MNKKIKQIFLPLFSLISCLFAIEVYLRFFPPQYLEVNNPYKYTKYERISERSYVEIYPLDYDIRNYYKKTEGKIYYNLNQYGARWKINGIQKVSGNCIIVLGDSLTYGFGLRFEDTYPNLVQRQLNQNGIKCEFINFAKPAYNTIDSANFYKDICRRIPHKLAIYGLHLNDLISFPTSRIINDVVHSYDPASRPVSALHRFVIQRIETKNARERNIKEILKLGNLNSEQFRNNIAAIKQMKSYADEFDIPFLVVILPAFINLQRYPFQPIHEILHRIFEQEEINYLDVTPAFKDWKAERLWILPFDQHPNEVAMQIIADKLSKKITMNYREYLKQ